jgi:hypothetical protein
MHTGVGPPVDTIGDIGDYYIDTEADIIYGPKAPNTSPLQFTDFPAPYTKGIVGDIYTVAMKYRFAVAGEVAGIRFFVDATGPVFREVVVEYGGLAGNGGTHCTVGAGVQRRVFRCPRACARQHDLSGVVDRLTRWSMGVYRSGNRRISGTNLRRCAVSGE